MPSIYKNIIFIDDEAVQNHINTIVINRLLRGPKINITSFTNPEEGLDYVTHLHCDDVKTTLLFLDLKMPGLNGWEFLDKLDQCSYEDIKCITIYILSSSIDPQDFKRALKHPLVVDFLSKPLSQHIKQIMAETVQALAQ